MQASAPESHPNRTRIAPDYAAKDPARGSLEAALDMMSQSYVLRYYERMGRVLESLIGDLGSMAGYTLIILFEICYNVANTRS